MTMNRQEVFEKASRHLLAQGVKSETEDGCLYRGPRELMCALGCLIPEGLYDKQIENSSPLSISHRGVILRNILAKAIGGGATLPPEDLNFLVDLQRVHDNNEPPCWMGELGKFAKYYKLALPEELKL